MRACYWVAMMLLSVLCVEAQEGYAGGVTGGGGGRTVTAATSEELRAYAKSEEPLTVQVSGNLVVGTVEVASNKTIEGTGSRPTLRGTLAINRGRSNVIIRNLILTNPKQKKNSEGYDGITVRGGRRVWIDHCTVKDCGDGAIDMTNGADAVTVSWCKFEYSSDDLKHRFVMLADGPPKSKKTLHLTLHHNWFAKNCGARMPAARRSRVHLFNNFFDTGEGTDYATNARDNSQLLSENNYYRKIKNPSYTEDGGCLHRSGDIFENCVGKRSDGRDKVFAPPYKYESGSAKDVPALVSGGAGCPL